MALRSAGRSIVDKLPVSHMRVRGDMSLYDIASGYYLIQMDIWRWKMWKEEKDREIQREFSGQPP